LHVCAADLDDILPLLNLLSDRIVQRLHSWDQPLLHIDRRRDVHCGGKRVVGRLGHVDMVVGVNRCLAPQLRAGDLAAAVGDHLIHIHVELRATARHPYVQREHVMMLAGEDLVADLNDQLMMLVVEPSACMICIRGGFLKDGVSRNHFAWDQVLANTEVLQGALGLRAPEFVSRNIYFAEAICFFANVRHFVFSFLYPSVWWPSFVVSPHRDLL